MYRRESLFFCDGIRFEYVIATDSDRDLSALALDVLERALDPQEGDPSRVALVAALYVLDGRGGEHERDANERGSSGGIGLDDSDGEALDNLLQHL